MRKTENPEITFIVPTLNEVKNIDKVLSLISISMAEIYITYEIIFIDDQSTDGTIELIENKKKLEKNIKLIISSERKGLGNALFIGMKYSIGKYIIFLDCDVSVNSKDLKSLISNRDEYSMVVGSRYVNGSKIIGANRFKIFLSKLFNYTIKNFFFLNIIDLSHSLRIFPNKIFYKPKILTHPGFFWEMSYCFKKHNYILKEIPVTFNEREYGVSKNKTKKMVKSVLKGLLVIYRRKIVHDFK